MTTNPGLEPGRTSYVEPSSCPTPPDLTDHLGKLEFPISKRELVERAEERDAPQDVRQALEALEPADFASRGELEEAVRSLSR